MHLPPGLGSYREAWARQSAYVPGLGWPFHEEQTECSLKCEHVYPWLLVPGTLGVGDMGLEGNKGVSGRAS